MSGGMKLDITDYELTVLIESLRKVAHFEAGMTQAPHLCSQEDYEEWKLAAKLEKSLQRSRLMRRLYEF